MNSDKPGNPPGPDRSQAGQAPPGWAEYGGAWPGQTAAQDAGPGPYGMGPGPAGAAGMAHPGAQAAGYGWGAPGGFAPGYGLPGTAHLQGPGPQGYAHPEAAMHAAAMHAAAMQAQAYTAGQHAGYGPGVNHAAASGHGPQGLAAALGNMADQSGLGMFKNLFNFEDDEFWKGALVGAAAVLLLTNENLRSSLLGSAAKTAEALKSGLAGFAQEAQDGNAGPADETPPQPDPTPDTQE